MIDPEAAAGGRDDEFRVTANDGVLETVIGRKVCTILNGLGDRLFGGQRLGGCTLNAELASWWN